MLNQLKKIIPAKMKQELKLLLNKGDKYTCPFCNYSSKNLNMIGFNFPVLKEKQVVGGGLRPAGCYQCRSTDRERLIYLYLKEEVKLFESGKDKSILHMAPEPSLTKALFDFGFENYVGGDLFQEGYENYPSYVKKIDVLNIPYKDNTFDLVICNHVLEHVPDDFTAMQELRRVLKIGGQAILQVPISKNTEKTFENLSVTDPKERELVFGQFDHIRLYGQDYGKRLEESGFKVKKINLYEKYIKYGLNKDEDIFICEI